MLDRFAARHAPALLAVVLTAGISSGCVTGPRVSDFPVPLSSLEMANPTRVPAVDQEFMWFQISDELDDYFRVRAEERVRVVRNTLTPGWIETYPTVGSSILEPWNRDANGAYERWLGTFQSIRRWARVTVVPDGNSYQIEVLVFKELEDLDRPSGMSAGAQTLRHDTSIEAEQDPSWYEPSRYGWIPMGRDEALEQRIIRNIVARLENP